VDDFVGTGIFSPLFA
jgi:hypothetical protein